MNKMVLDKLISDYNLPPKLERMVEDGDLEIVKNFQPSLFSLVEFYKMSNHYDWDNSFRDFGVIPNGIIHDYYGVKPTPQYYYRR